MAATGDASRSEAIARFHKHLTKSTRVMALLGAGLSASSGLPTFRGAGGLWRSHDSVSLATPRAFERDPALVWRFYSYRRHMALQAQPNPAHHALAQLARKMPEFITLSQNVDGLSQRADHPRDQLKLLHGTLFEVKCTDDKCAYVAENFEDPIVPALGIPTDGRDPTTHKARHEVDISDASVHLPDIARENLPTCPQCKTSLLRPNVVWFGEQLPQHVLDSVGEFLEGHVDLIMVIGTSAQVTPAANYIFDARMRGARVCVINMDTNDAPRSGWAPDDFLFQGDAAQLVPELLRPIIGEVGGRAG